MGRLGNINNYVAAQSDAKKQEVNQQYDQLQQTQQQPVQQQPPQAPISQPSIAAATNSNPMAGAEQVDFREKTLQNLSEEDFLKRQKDLNASSQEYYLAQVKAHPESAYYNMRAMLESAETPKEKAKRERREALEATFRNLGNVIGNAANLYYAHRGGTPIDLNTANEKHNERIRQLKEKQDAIQRQREQIFLNAKINDIKSERAKELAEAKTKKEALEHERKLAILEIENMYKLGQIDAQTKAKMQEVVTKAENAQELEATKQSNREKSESQRQQNRKELKRTPTYRDEQKYNPKGVINTVSKPDEVSEKKSLLPGNKRSSLLPK